MAGFGAPGSRFISPAAFYNAPKFHTGGIIGAPKLRNDEVPIIAQRKEGIFTPEQMAALSPAGSSNNFSFSAPIHVDYSGDGSPETSEALARQIRVELESSMRGIVVDEIGRQMRPGNLMGGM